MVISPRSNVVLWNAILFKTKFFIVSKQSSKIRIIMMRRILELIDDVRGRYADDSFFSNFEHSCQISDLKTIYYRAYNKALMVLDDESWQILKDKALQHYLDHRQGQKRQGFFNRLNEAFAYRYLVNKGFDDVRFIKEGKNKSPDIRFKVNNTQNFCEVKTICISNNEISQRSAGGTCHDSLIYVRLTHGFLNKFCYAINQARQQISSFGFNGLVYIIINFDDSALDNYNNYRKQLIELSKDHGFSNLFIKIGLLGNRRISIN
jgi:hypothetical protein